MKEKMRTKEKEKENGSETETRTRTRSYAIVGTIAIVLIGAILVTPATAQLADTPWPTKYQNNCRTSLSPYVGPAEEPSVKWTLGNFERVGAIPMYSPVIGVDGTIYATGYNWTDNSGLLYAINPDGTVKWVISGNYYKRTPSIDASGIIYVYKDIKYIEAIYPNGTVKWSVSLPFEDLTTPAIGADGTIYVTGYAYYSGVSAIYPNGTVKWTIRHPPQYYMQTHVPPAIGPDGTIYCSGRTSIPSKHPIVRAINPNGTEKWNFTGELEGEFQAHAIGSDGTIYAVEGSQSEEKSILHAINPDGTEKWNFTVPYKYGYYMPLAIGPDDTIYFARIKSDYTEGRFYAINPDGTEKWNKSWIIYNAIMVDAAGTIYVGYADPEDWHGELKALNPDGTEKWNISLSTWRFFADADYCSSSLAMDSDGTIYGIVYDSNTGGTKLYAFGAPVPPTPPKPFVIYGWVNYSNGTAVLNPNVTITNLNTSEVFVANTSPDSNYYQVVTTSYNISAGDVLHFNASDTNKTEFNHTVTQDEIDNGGFMQNITIVPAVPPGKPDLLVTAINAYHNNTGCDAWFNLSNEIDVTVKNNGTGVANASNVSLYIDGVFFGKLPVPSLAAGANVTVTFRNWKPIGVDCLNPPCDFNWSYKEYNFTAVADCDGEVEESDETNNEMSVEDRACYNGYMADEPLENVAHGMLNGHIIFTTGDGVYTGLYSVGSTQTTHYDINLPDGAVTRLALLYVYYTWCKPASGVDYACPEMEVSITTPDGTTYTLPLERAYNDTKCTCPYAMWNYPFGTYVYNVTDYITANGTYTVTVKNVCTQCSYFCVAAPGLLILYEDTNAPLIEYWLNEGADVLMGGRRYPTSSNLAWWECINNATFTASSQTEEVKSATLGVVAPWGGSSWSPGMTNYLFFNGIKLGTGVYHGYDNSYDGTIDGITMHIGSTYAQVGVNVTDVTAYYMNGSDNVVGQADDGDNMMPAGAFLVVTYKVPAGICGDVNGDGEINMDDVMTLWYDYANYPYPGAYTVSNEWAADVNGDGEINMDDVMTLWYDYANYPYPGAYEVNCRG